MMSVLSHTDLSKLRFPAWARRVTQSELHGIIEAEAQTINDAQPTSLDFQQVRSQKWSQDLFALLAMREQKLRQSINTAAREALLVTASGTNLDNIAALFNVQRKIIRVADDSDESVASTVLESDEQLRTRAQFALSAISNAGTEKAYLYRILSADERVKHANVFSPEPGQVEVRVLSHVADGYADNKLLEKVSQAINATYVRPLTDQVTVLSAQIIPYTVAVEITVGSEQHQQSRYESAINHLQRYVNEHSTLGASITHSGILSALSAVDSINVTVIEPPDDIYVSPRQSAFCASENISVKTVVAKKQGGVPLYKAQAITVNDTGLKAGRLSGNCELTGAVDDSDITHYNIYWGKSALHKLTDQPLMSLTKTGPLKWNFQPDLKVVEGASHLLVYSANGNGEMSNCVAWKIVDKAVPCCPARSVSINNKKLVSDKLSGIVRVEKADNPVDIDSYNLYWGETATTKIDGLARIALLDRGSSLEYKLDGATIPQQAKYIVVLTANNDGEMTRGVGTPIDPPNLDSPDQLASALFLRNSKVVAVGKTMTLSGTIEVKPAVNDRQVTRYRLYWGSNAFTKLTDKPFLVLQKATLIHTLQPDIVIPQGATHILVYTANSYGEMTDGIGQKIAAPVLVSDNRPKKKVMSLELSATEIISQNQSVYLTGIMTIRPAADQESIARYNFYWASKSGKRLSDQAFYSRSKTDELTFDLKTDVPVPETATHLLVAGESEQGETIDSCLRELPFSFVPQYWPVGISLQKVIIETVGNERSLYGTIDVERAVDEELIEQYRLYWGSNALTKMEQQPFASLDKGLTVNPLSYTFIRKKSIPQGATHILVFSANRFAEMKQGLAQKIPL